MIPVFDDTAPFVLVAYGLTLLGWCLATLAVFQRSRKVKTILDREQHKEEQRGK